MKAELDKAELDTGSKRVWNKPAGDKKWWQATTKSWAQEGAAVNGIDSLL